MKNFRDEKRWQKCHELVVAIYRLSASFPEDDAGVMAEELRNTALLLQISIEDALRRRSRKKRGIPGPLDVASGKLARLENGLIMCKDIKYGDPKTLEKLNGMIDEVRKIVDAMLGKRAVRARDRRQDQWVKWANSITSGLSPSRGDAPR